MIEQGMKKTDSDSIIFALYDVAMRLAALNPRRLSRKNDYGDGEIHTGIEMHTLYYVVTHPDCTVTEIAENWGKTVGSISQTIKKLRNDGMIVQRPDPSNERRNLLQATEKGLHLNMLQNRREIERTAQGVKELKEKFTDEDLLTAIAVLETLHHNGKIKYGKTQSDVD